MGCDGGTIPKRDELVRTKKKPEQKDKTSELSFRWQHCAITQQPLQTPVVACELGRLYSKESVLEALLDKSAEKPVNEIPPYIKSLKDVKQLVLTENSAWKESDRGEIGDGYIDVQKAKWVCPISGMEMNGRFRFCCLWTCGCVISEKALKEMNKIKEEGNECPSCQKLFQVLDIVLLNPTEDFDVGTMKEKMSLRRILLKEAKEAKKAGKKRAAPATVTSNASECSKSSSSSDLTPEAVASARGLSNQKSADESPSSKKSKIVSTPKPPTAAAAATSNTSGIVVAKPKKESKLKPGTSAYSVAKDPAASEVYKSLFTTHRNAETQERAHWVTYNPFYN